LAVSTLTKLGEPVSENTWIFALANGLKAEFEDTRKGVLFGRPGYDTVIDVKKSIINEEIVLATMKDNGKVKVKDAKDKDSTAFVAKDHSGLNCHYCGIKGHIQPDCRKKKRDDQQSQASTHKKGHGGKGEGKPSSKGKKGKGISPTITTTDTLMKGGPHHLATKDRGINQTKDNGTRTTKVHGPAITKAKIQKASTKAVDVVLTRFLC
jgi:hypothetical protein